jgi:hypothetical protein
MRGFLLGKGMIHTTPFHNPNGRRESIRKNRPALDTLRSSSLPSVSHAARYCSNHLEPRRKRRGGNTGSNPVGDAYNPNNLLEIPFLPGTQRGHTTFPSNFASFFVSRSMVTSIVIRAEAWRSSSCTTFTSSPFAGSKVV